MFEGTRFRAYLAGMERVDRMPPELRIGGAKLARKSTR
jgi:hypothetical protein